MSSGAGLFKAESMDGHRQELIRNANSYTPHQTPRIRISGMELRNLF